MARIITTSVPATAIMPKKVEKGFDELDVAFTLNN